MRFIKIVTAILLFAVAAIEITCNTNMTITTMATTGGLILAAPVTLSTQKIVFLTSLKEEYEQVATWLNEAEDLSTFVEDGQTLVFPEAGAAPAVYKNRITDVDNVEPTETVFKSELDVYDSQNYKIRNIYLHALPYEKIQHYTRKSATAIIKREIEDAAYAFAPEGAGSKRVIIPTTGGVRGGLKTLSIEDIVTLARECDKEKFPETGRNLVLSWEMWWDLINNNAILKGQLERTPQTGIINPNIVEYYGIKIHKSLGDNLGIVWKIATSEKMAQGTAISVSRGLVPAALLFCSGQVFRAGGSVEMYYKEKSQNTEGRAYEFGFQHRFKADFQMSAQRYSGLIYAAK